MKELPKDFEKNFDKTEADKIAVGDFVIYRTKDREFKGMKKEAKWVQGYVTMIQNEAGKVRFEGTDEGQVIGFNLRGKNWTANTSYITEIHKSNMPKDQFKKKAKKALDDQKPEREAKRKRIGEAEKVQLETDKQESKDLENKPDLLSTIQKELEAELNPEKKPEKKPRKTSKPTSQPRTKKTPTESS